MNVRRFELFVSNILRLGVVISGLLIFIGLSLFVITGDVCYPNGNTSLDWIIFGDPFFSPSHILFIGFLSLVLTPFLRVAASVLAYFHERDWVYTAITTFVLVVLLIGLILGIG